MEVSVELHSAETLKQSMLQRFEEKPEGKEYSDEPSVTHCPYLHLQWSTVERKIVESTSLPPRGCMRRAGNVLSAQSCYGGGGEEAPEEVPGLEASENSEQLSDGQPEEKEEVSSGQKPISSFLLIKIHGSDGQKPKEVWVDPRGIVLGRGPQNFTTDLKKVSRSIRKHKF